MRVRVEVGSGVLATPPASPSARGYGAEHILVDTRKAGDELVGSLRAVSLGYRSEAGRRTQPPRGCRGLRPRGREQKQASCQKNW